MKTRVTNILLVSNFYDAFVLEEDGGLAERMFSDYVDLNLRFIPRIHQAASAEEGLAKLERNDIDMVITMPRIYDMDVDEFGKRVKEMKPGTPVILLTYEWMAISTFTKPKTSAAIDKVFCWMGDARILLAIIKYWEDVNNVDKDLEYGVRVILVVEDSPRYSSIFFPIIFTEIMTQTRKLIFDGVNDFDRLLRMRARPKILMAESYEEGIELYQKYKKNLLGVISDVGLPRKGSIDYRAGFKLAKKFKEEINDLPILMQSSNLDNKELAYHFGFDFLFKHSYNLVQDLRQFIMDRFGFGNFVFKDSLGLAVAEASNLFEFEKALADIPADSLEYHATRNDFSRWLRARTEFDCAETIRPKRVSDFDSIEELREHIIGEIKKVIRRNQFGVIGDFGKTQFDSLNSFVKLGTGSLGGKARGIAFFNALLAHTKFHEKFDNIEVRTPRSLVLCSTIFEEFVKANNLQEFAISEEDNDKIAQRFLKAELPEEVVLNLKVVLEKVSYPIAVRSSSLLEDSQSLPFAGLYSTYMLPNNNPHLRFRLRELCDAIKLVYASVFYRSPKEYVRNMNFRIEEEKMAVIIQQIVGQNYNNRFYPVISGITQSYNYYPISHMRADEGVVELTLGLGMNIVEGGKSYRFSPKYPQIAPPYASPAEFMKKSQSRICILNSADPNLSINYNEKFSLIQTDLSDAEKDGTLFFVGSTYNAQDNTISDTLSIDGPRVVTFANILKYDLFPLPDLINEVLTFGKEAFGSHVEIEFAVNLYEDKKKNPEFYLLQIRPMVVGKENTETNLDDISIEEMVCASNHAMGNGAYKNIYDIVYLDPQNFDPSKTRIIAEEVGRINRSFIEADKQYVLIGFGRWGTSDPSLGVPVEWHQISKARIVIETNLEDFIIDPSLGSHFFHNLTSLGMAYLHIPRQKDEEFIRWDWLAQQKTVYTSEYVKHIQLDKPLDVRINGVNSRGAIMKPHEHEPMS